MFVVALVDDVAATVVVAVTVAAKRIFRGSPPTGQSIELATFCE